MPSFRKLSDKELGQLAGYVVFLSMRGEAETRAVMRCLEDDAGEEELPTLVEEGARFAARAWKASEAKALKVPPKEFTDEERRASITRGYQQFTKGISKCIACHQDFGRTAEYHWDEWGRINRTPDLTRGKFRGGSRGEDLYARIAVGMVGAQKPAFSDVLSADDIWDLVNFHKALPTPTALPEDVRKEIYPREK
jgi:mono/diheme cytochrome c family protein